MTDYLYNGVSEYDIWGSYLSNLPLFAAKLWGRGDMESDPAQAASDALGEAPRTNFGYEVDSANRMNTSTCRWTRWMIHPRMIRGQ